MKIIAANDIIPEKTAIALGIFDGVHSGHEFVFRRVNEYRKDGLVPAVFTFRTESLRFKRGEPFEYIYTNEQKLRLIEKNNIEYALCPDFDEMKELSGEEFVREILVKCMNVAVVVCGDNFRFGKGAACGSEELKALGEKYGFKVDVIRLKENRISSKQFREMLKAGAACGSGLFSYTLYAKVVKGNQIGRTLEFPTINQQYASGQLVPKRGVYHTFTTVDGKTYNSVTNIGVKPTVEKNIRPLAETHILDFSGDLYGKRVEVGFLGLIREEKKFGSLDELKKQVFEDIEAVRKANAGVVCQRPSGKD